MDPSDFCTLVFNDCAVGTIGQLPKDPYATTLAVIRKWPDGRQEYVQANCHAIGAKPQLTPLMVKQAIEKLVPKPSVGIAPPGGRTLVNEQTVLWADTPADRDLGTVTLLRIFRVGLRVHVDHVDWDFGDGHTDVTATPGAPYEKGEHCREVTCPGHYGHIYATTGDMTVGAQVSWTGQYAVNGGAWQDIDGTVTGPQQTARVGVIEARGVLVPDPQSS